jgi:hypothetical protein
VGDYCVVVAIDADETFPSPLSTRPPTFTTPSAPLDLDAPLLSGSDSQTAFGLDLGGRASGASNLLEPLPEHVPMSSLGTQRDALPNLRAASVQHTKAGGAVRVTRELRIARGSARRRMDWQCSERN